MTLFKYVLPLKTENIQFPKTFCVVAANCLNILFVHLIQIY